MQLGGALGDQHGSGGVQGVRDGVLQEHGGAGLDALSLPLLCCPAAALVPTLATQTLLFQFQPDVQNILLVLKRHGDVVHMYMQILLYLSKPSGVQDDPSNPTPAPPPAAQPNISAFKLNSSPFQRE